MIENLAQHTIIDRYVNQICLYKYGSANMHNMFACNFAITVYTRTPTKVDNYVGIQCHAYKHTTYKYV